MAVNVFISYSHKDELFKENFEEHLSSLKDQNIVNVWHDRKIIPGQEWKDEIDNNLKNSEIIIFLISSSFNNSEYCKSIELTQAILQHEEGKSILIPVIVRACDWENYPYGKFQGLPKDAKPISSWIDQDAGWLNVIQGLRKSITEFEKNKKKVKTEIDLIDSGAINLKKSTLDWLLDTEVQLTHRLVDRVRLNNIYVVPDFEEYDSNNKKLISTVNASSILESMENYIIFGDDQIGKTSLLKYYYFQFAKAKHFIVYVDLKDKKNNITDFEKIIKRNLDSQYENLDYEYFMENNPIILFDNFDKSILNNRTKNSLLEEFIQQNAKLIITCDFEYSYILDNFEVFDLIKRYKLMGLGNKKREELVRSWVALGQEGTIEDEQLYAEVDVLIDNINKVLQKNIVPARPIYILIILQMFEAHKKLDIELTSLGHCYQELIYKTFENARVKHNDYGKYLNVLTELAWWMFKNESSITESDLKDFFTYYDDNFLSIMSEKEVIVQNLLDCRILSIDSACYQFKYPYIQYFFIGKKIAENCNDNVEFQLVIDNLVEKLYREDFANILIFVTHHTKSKLILNKIKSCFVEQFSTNAEASFKRNELEFITDFISQIPKMVIEQREVQKERDSHNEKLDELEYETEAQQEPDEEDSKSYLSDINRLFKSIEISGQIIKNRHYNLTKEEINELSTSGIDAGLRFLKHFIEISEQARESIVRLIADNLSNDPNLSNLAIREYAEKSYLFLTYSVLSATIQKISYSIGTKEAYEIYQKIAEEKDSPAYQLIRLAIELHFNKKVDIAKIAEMNQSFKDNVVCQRLMKEFIIQHMYMYPVGYKIKQQISELLDIPMDKQRKLDQETKHRTLIDFNNIKRSEEN